jgi:hypothetical protein
MFSPVESQAIFLSKETPIVSVGLRTAEVSYTNQNKTAWNSKSDKWWVNHFTSVQTFSGVNESFSLAKYFHPFKFLTFRQFICPLSLFLKEIPFPSFPNTTDLKIWASFNVLFDWLNRFDDLPLFIKSHVESRDVPKKLTQHLYDLRFSRRFILVRVAYLSSSKVYTNNWGLFGKENYLAFDWW